MARRYLPLGAAVKAAPARAVRAARRRVRGAAVPEAWEALAAATPWWVLAGAVEPIARCVIKEAAASRTAALPVAVLNRDAVAASPALPRRASSRAATRVAAGAIARRVPARATMPPASSPAARHRVRFRAKAERPVRPSVLAIRAAAREIARVPSSVPRRPASQSARRGHRAVWIAADLRARARPIVTLRCATPCPPSARTAAPWFAEQPARSTWTWPRAQARYQASGLSFPRSTREQQLVGC